MKTKLFGAALLLALISATTVYADDNRITVEVEGLTQFDKIISNGAVDVDFTVGEVQQVSVKGKPDEVDCVNLSIVGRTLYVGVKEDKRLGKDPEVKVIIKAPDLTCAIVSGCGDIDIRNLHTTSFTATVSGNGDIEISGRCDEADFTVTGSGNIEAGDFTAEMVNATVNGSGDIECRVTDTLTASVVGSGEIKFHGHPRTVNRSGRKSSIRHEDW